MVSFGLHRFFYTTSRYSTFRDAACRQSSRPPGPIYRRLLQIPVAKAPIAALAYDSAPYQSRPELVLPRIASTKPLPNAIGCLK